MYMYVGWGLGVGDLCTGMWDGVASSTCTKCLHEETVSMEPHIILQMCLNVRIKYQNKILSGRILFIVTFQYQNKILP